MSKQKTHLQEFSSFASINLRDKDSCGLIPPYILPPTPHTFIQITPTPSNRGIGPQLPPQYTASFSLKTDQREDKNPQYE